MPRCTLERTLVFIAVLAAAPVWAGEKGTAVDFNRDIRPVLSNNCFKCHGPDAKNRKGGADGLRLDNEEGAFADQGGYAVIVKGKPADSELVRRITAEDESERMPPVESGKKLTPAEIELLTRWVEQGAPYARHWSYMPVVRPAIPAVQDSAWPRNTIDYFILARLEREGLHPSAEADRYALIRRLSLDLIGLPPSLEDVDRFVHDPDPEAYEKLVDRLLASDAYGEHWARMWLDLARYADSAGYADDPPRTIWAYRDYVIRSFNANKRFDQFTIEQIAGDLLPSSTLDQLVATAFHRNTMTNNEGGTNDEEFRNVAIVDRVNTTMAVWMGTTINCCQCHNHKFDPLTQKEFFQLFAFFNNTADADRTDESPVVEIWTEEQKQAKATLAAEISKLEKELATTTPELEADQAQWEKQFAREPVWESVRPASVQLRSGGAATIGEDGSISATPTAGTDVYTLQIPLDSGDRPQFISAVQIETLPHESLPGRGAGLGGGNFVISRVLASVVLRPGAPRTGRFIRVELPGKKRILSLAEVQVFHGQDNIARSGTAQQSSTDYGAPAQRAIDGNTDGNFDAHSTTHTAALADPWWELDLGSPQPIDRVVLWNRTDNNLQSRLKDGRVVILNAERRTVWETRIADPPNPSAEFVTSAAQPVKFSAAFADFAQQGFAAADVLADKSDPDKGWAVGPQVTDPHTLTLLPAVPLARDAGSRLVLTIEQLSKHANHELGRFRIRLSGDAAAVESAWTPAAIRDRLKTASSERSAEDRAAVASYYRSIAPRLEPQRLQLAGLQKRLADMKPDTTVPEMRELPDGQRRVTRIQHRGNYLDVSDEVQAGTPAAFPPLPDNVPRDRLALARWLVDPSNPLTARVLVNRYWEAVFGIGLVRTSEDFGSQGELPSHPELLDYLAADLTSNGWDLKRLLKQLVTSATYRQSSRVSEEQLERDPDNRLLARGPRFRMSAEMVRDQALAVSGLLSPKMYGPPVKPPQPSSGLSAAFGSGIDWQASQGTDRYRRGLYTTWRRSNPYPSMTAFDAPNREVCMLHRSRTNTPLQALVTLNDPVYIEAAQALARRMIARGGSETDKAAYGFRLCLARYPEASELDRLVSLYHQAHEQYAHEPDKAQELATKPLGPAAEGTEMADLAAWTVVGNVLLNLDEMFMKR